MARRRGGEGEVGEVGEVAESHKERLQTEFHAAIQHLRVQGSIPPPSDASEMAQCTIARLRSCSTTFSSTPVTTLPTGFNHARVHPVLWLTRGGYTPRPTALLGHHILPSMHHTPWPYPSSRPPRQACLNVQGRQRNYLQTQRPPRHCHTHPITTPFLSTLSP